MASAYSILRNYGEYIQPYDFNLIQQGLEYKQQKFDANAALIQTQIDQFANLQLAKGEDQDYLNDRLNTLVDQVNEFGSIDLSSNGVTRNIENHVKQVLDENVMNAYAGTKNLQRYQQEVATYKKDSPEQYSQINEMYGMRGAIEWLNDGQAGTTFKGSSYTPFVDVQGKIDKTIETMVKNTPENVVKIPTNDGRIIEKKVKELNAEEIRSVATQMIDVNDKQQLSINGWFNFGRQSSIITGEVFDNYKKQRVGMLEGEISALTLKKKGGVDSTVAEELDQRISFLNRQKNQFELRTSNIPRNSESIGTFLEEEKVINGLIDKNAFREVSIAYENDVAYWNSIDHQYRQVKDNRDFQLALRKQNFTEANTASKAKLDPANLQTISRITNPEEQGIDVEGTIFNDIRTGESTRQAVVDEFYDNMIVTDPDKQAEFDKAVVTWKQLPENLDKSDAEIKTEVALNLSNNAQNTDFMSVENYTRLKAIDNQLKQNKQILVDATSKASLSVNKQADKLYGVVNTNPNITTFDIVNGQKVKKSYTQYLKDRGINSFEDLKRNKPEFDKFLMQGHADLLLNSMTKGNNLAVGESKFDESVPEFQYYLNQIARINGEQIDFTDVFNITKTRKISGDTPNPFGDSYNKVFALKESSVDAPKTLEFLKNIIETQSFDTSAGFSDDSFQDDSTSRNILSYDAQQEAYRDSLAEDFGKLPQNKTIALPPKTSLHAEAVLFAEGTNNKFKVDDNTTLNVFTNPADVNTVIIEQVQSAGKSKGEILEQSRTATIPLKDLQGTQLASAINFQNSKSLITAENMRPIEKSNITFAEDTNVDYFEGLQEHVLGENNSNLEFVTKQGVKNSLIKEYGAFLSDENGNPTELSNIVNNFVENPNIFTLKAKPNTTQSSINMEINFKNQRGETETLDVVDLQTKEFDDYQKIYDSAPQIFLYISMKKILDETISESILSGGQIENTKIQKLKKLYNLN